MTPPLLAVTDLKVHFPIRRGFLLDRTVGHVKAVDGVSFEIEEGQTLGLVGESGSGKSTTAYAALQLIRPTAGSVRFLGRELTRLRPEELRRMRREMQIVFQDPYASLNPRMTVGRILAEPLRTHGIGNRRTCRASVARLLELVGLEASYTNRYPHEFSGGQRQRIGIARALALNPKLIVCDEPVSALDVSIQAQIVNLLEALQRDFELTFLFIAHDLAVVRHISTRIAVMYLGRIVEVSPADELYAHPLHPYTISLLSAVPIPDPAVESRRRPILLTGDVPSPVSPPAGCRFHTRCPFAQPTRCRDEVPELRALEAGREVACHWAEEIRSGTLTAAGSAPGNDA